MRKKAMRKKILLVLTMIAAGALLAGCGKKPAADAPAFPLICNMGNKP